MPENDRQLPKSIRNLPLISAVAVPISVEERKQRIARAQQLMEQEKIDAVFMEGTTSCYNTTLRDFADTRLRVKMELIQKM